MFLFARLLGFRHVDDAGTLVCGTVWEEREFVLEAVQTNGLFGDVSCVFWSVGTWRLRWRRRAVSCIVIQGPRSAGCRRGDGEGEALNQPGEAGGDNRGSDHADL